MTETAEHRPVAGTAGPPGPPARRRGDPLVVAAVVAALVPIVVATARAVADGWLPIGDNALFAIRSRDVFTSHPPLLGTWTSASITAGTHLNNPGPLLFDVFAVPATLFPGGAGVAVGAALLNAASVVGIAVFGRRLGGPVLATMAVAAAALLCWAMGSELLFDPWQPHSLLLPFLLLLVVVWALTHGDLAALPWAVAAASLVVQTHMSYVVLVGALAALGVAGLVLSLRARRADDPDGWAALRRRTGRTVAVASAVLGLCWAQPLVEQLSAGDDGNMARLATSLDEAEQSVGPALGTRVVANVVALPPWWLRPSFEDALRPTPTAPRPFGPGVRMPDLPSLGLSVAGLAAVAAVLAVAGRAARRRGDGVALTGIATTAVALAAALVTAATLPVGVFGLAPHQYRWLWPISLLGLLAVSVTAARAVDAPPARSRLSAAATVVVAVAAVLTLPTHRPEAGPVADADAIPVMADLGEQLSSIEGEGPLLVDLRRGLRFAEPYSSPVMAELQRRGVRFFVDDPGLVRQLGDHRAFDGRAASTLLIREGEAARAGVPGAERVAFHDDLDASEREELARLEAAVVDHLREEGVTLNRRGEAAARSGDVPGWTDDEPPEPDEMVASGALVQLVGDDLLAVDPPWRARYRRYAALRWRADRLTVGVFVARGAPR